jgi:AmiR/NasT family two-component response regulator
MLLLALARREAEDQGMTDRSLANGVRLNEASGMVSIQAHCSFTEAVVLMRARGKQTNRSIEDIATGVLDHSIRFGA